MTNLSDLSPKKPNRLIIIHGLNNNTSSFIPLTEHFKQMGHEIFFVVLPCHGHDRNEARDFKEAFACFDRSMRDLTTTPFNVLAFSQGALFLQLWLQKRPDRLPLAQILLAPALYIHRHQLIKGLTKILPSFIKIISLSPKPIRRYASLTVGEYRILLEGVSTYQKLNPPLKVPTLVLIDPKDELVEAELLKERLEAQKSKFLNFQFLPRTYLKKGIGCHHILFHPEYFSQEDWESFSHRINVFLKVKD